MKENRPIVVRHKHFSKEEIIDQLKNIILELKVIDNLNVYTAVYKVFSSENTKGRKGHYSLILLNSRDNTVKFTFYSAVQFDLAVKAYLQLEKEHLNDKQINIVLVNTDDLKKLNESYPNYFMDTKHLVRNLSLIMLDKFFP